MNDKVLFLQEIATSDHFKLYISIPRDYPVEYIVYPTDEQEITKFYAFSEAWRSFGECQGKKKVRTKSSLSRLHPSKITKALIKEDGLIMVILEQEGNYSFELQAESVSGEYRFSVHRDHYTLFPGVIQDFEHNLSEAVEYFDKITKHHPKDDRQEYLAFCELLQEKEEKR